MKEPPQESHRGTTRMYFRVLPDRTLARRMIAAPSAPGRDGMPDYRGYRYEVQEVEVADLFQGLVWPPGTHHAAPGLDRSLCTKRRRRRADHKGMDRPRSWEDITD